MIQAFLIRYAMQLLGILVITLSIAGGYYYWKHQVVSAALDERNRGIELQTVAIQASENAKISIITQHYKDQYEAAIASYADYVKRLRNVKTSSNKNRMPAEANCPARVDRSSEEALSIKAVELLIEQFIIPNMEVK